MSSMTTATHLVRTTPPTRPLVLVADDDAVIRTMMMEVLRRAGFEVVGAIDGAEAIAATAERRPDVVVIDMEMPGTNGCEAIGALRADPALRTLPVIVVSGSEDVRSRVLALNLGADDFLVKPAAPDELVARVRAQLRIASAWSGAAQAVGAEHSDTRAARKEHERWLESVVRDQAFDIWFQPIVDIRTGLVVAQEALARFHDGTSPGDVFEVATRCERRVALELALVDKAITAARGLPDSQRLHVNVSPLAAAAPELVPLIERADQDVVIEITENELFDASGARALRESLPSGCTVAADDVGAGYAGLAQLLDVRPDIVKIDRTVVASIDADRGRQALVAGLVRFGAATDCILIAEGVERPEERATLLALGVTHGQGYDFGRPAPLVDVESSRYATT